MPSFADLQQEIATMLDVADDELTAEQRAEMDAYLSELGQMEADKIDAFCSFLRLEGARADAIRKEAHYLTKRAQTIENRLANLKAYYMRIMLENGLAKVAGTTHNISLRNSRAVHIEDTAIATLPESFLKVERTPIKAAIKHALESGQELAGCSIVERQSLMVA